jgi:hypothetical protein
MAMACENAGRKSKSRGGTSLVTQTTGDRDAQLGTYIRVCNEGVFFTYICEE